MSGDVKTVHLDMTRFDLPLLIDALHLRRGVEVGVFQGYYSYYLLRHSRIEMLWCVDAWLGKWAQYEQDARDCLADFADRTRIVRMTSVEAAALAESEDQRFDFIYIDGNHHRRSVLTDLQVWRRVTANPCLLAGHDYWQANMTGVVQAVDEFAGRNGLTLYLTRERCASWFMLLE